jgi:hypothetical protein
MINGDMSASSMSAHSVESATGIIQHWPANTSSSHWNETAQEADPAATHDTVKMEFAPVILNETGSEGSVLSIGNLEFYTAQPTEAYYEVSLTGSSVFNSSAGKVSSTSHRWQGIVQLQLCSHGITVESGCSEADIKRGVGLFILLDAVPSGTRGNGAVNTSADTLLIPLAVDNGQVIFRRLVVLIKLVGRFLRGHHSSPSGTRPFRFQSMIKAPSVVVVSTPDPSTSADAAGKKEKKWDSGTTAAWLAAMDLQRYTHAVMVQNGYDSLRFVKDAERADITELASACGMLAPHARTLLKAWERLTLKIDDDDSFLDRRCSHSQQHILCCLNVSHYTLRSCATGKVNISSATACRASFTCSPSTGSCAAPDLATHLMRSVDYQIVQNVPATEAATCSDDPLADAMSGKMLCEVLHATKATQPTFGEYSRFRFYTRTVLHALTLVC